MTNTEFKECIENYDFDRAFEIAKNMNEQKIVEELVSLAHLAESTIDRVGFLPFTFAYKYKFLIDDIKWNYVLMRLIDSAYICYKGMPDIVLECATRLLTLDDTHLIALQSIINCYEQCESHCSEELYIQAKKKMDELGYTMRTVL